MLIDGNKCSTSAMIIKTSFIESNNLLFNESKDFITVEDYGLWLDMAKLNAKFLFVDKNLGEYLIHSGNNSLKIDFHWDNCKNLLEHHVSKLKVSQNEKDNLLSIISARLKIQKAFAYFSQGFAITALKLLLESFFASPKHSFNFLIKRFSLK